MPSAAITTSASTLTPLSKVTHCGPIILTEGDAPVSAVQYAAGQPARQSCHQIRTVHAQRADRGIAAGDLMREDRPARREYPPAVDGRGTAHDRIRDAEPLQYPHAVGKEPNSRANLAELGGLLDTRYASAPAVRSANAADRPPIPPPTTTTRTDLIATSGPVGSARTPDQL